MKEQSGERFETPERVPSGGMVKSPAVDFFRSRGLSDEAADATAPPDATEPAPSAKRARMEKMSTAVPERAEWSAGDL